MKNVQWWVEYDFTDTPYGRRAMCIKVLHSEAEATSFAATKADAVVIETWET